MKHTVEVMIPEAEIKARIAELGRQITERYKDSGSDMVLVGLLRGSFMFMADLCREVQVSHEVDFMTASSYGSGMSTTRDVKILKDLDEDIRGKDVLIVEDIIDSGNTLSKVREILSLREPKSLAIGKAGAANAALLAAQILATHDKELHQRLNDWRKAQTDEVLENPDPRGAA